MLGQAIEGLNNKDDIIVMPGAWGGANRNCFVGYLTRGVMQKKLEKIFNKKIKNPPGFPGGSNTLSLFSVPAKSREQEYQSHTT